MTAGLALEDAGRSPAEDSHAQAGALSGRPAGAVMTAVNWGVADSYPPIPGTDQGAQ